jgi:hypothetical protein
VRLPWRYLALRPGDHVQLVGSTQTWRVSGVTLEHMVVSLDLVPIASTTAPLSADAGRPVVQIDSPHGPTTLALLDLPPLGDAAPRDVTLAIAAAGVSPGWRRAALLASNDSGARWTEVGVTALPATMGTAVTALGQAAAGLVDRVNNVDVTLLNSNMSLADADMGALLAGTNLTMLGDEVIQFGRAVPIGPAQWRLSHLLRGRRGTEAAISGHSAGERFVLLDQASLLLLDAAFAQPGVQVMAVGISDGDAPPVATAATVGRSLQPLTPVHPRILAQTNGDRLISWIRRSREGWAWRDRIDAAVGEEGLRFRITITPSSGPARIVESESETYRYPAADRAADAGSGATYVTFAIQHIGARGLSLPLTLTLPLT